MLPLKVEPLLNISCCVALPDTSVSETLGVSAPKTNITCWTREATGKIKLPCCKKSYAQQPLALVHSTAEYCDPACCHSNHTPCIDKLINYALRMLTGCLRPFLRIAYLLLAEKKISKSPTRTSYDNCHT